MHTENRESQAKNEKAQKYIAHKAKWTMNLHMMHELIGKSAYLASLQVQDS